MTAEYKIIELFLLRFIKTFRTILNYDGYSARAIDFFAYKHDTKVRIFQFASPCITLQGRLTC